MIDGFYLCYYENKNEEMECKYILKITKVGESGKYEVYEVEHIFRLNPGGVDWEVDSMKYKIRDDHGANLKKLTALEICDIVGEDLYGEWIIGKIL